MEIGDTVYTVNAKTNTVENWKYNGVLKTPDDILVHLVNGKFSCFLPLRCVYASKDNALALVNKKF